MRKLVFLGLLAAASAAHAEDGAVKYGPPPAWVKPAPARAVKATAAPGEALQILLWDDETSLQPRGEETYGELKAKILTTEGLSVGNLSFAWDPQVEDLTVNRVTVTRDGKVIDVLATDKFTVLRREQNLEQAMLDGRLTANLQIKGLQVGDIVDVATTHSHHDPLLAGHPEYMTQLPVEAVDGKVRLRVLWPKDLPVQWRASPDLKTEGGKAELDYQSDGLTAVTLPDRAPPRYHRVRFVEASAFSSWAEASALMAPLYAKAATLAPDSPLKAEAAKIKAATDDPTQRMLMALKLVQDQTRYVYVGLDSGAYRPAKADETWSRRFGDCKAKTVLLLALLNELGVKAEPVLADIGRGDGMDLHLPRIDVFDHVLVRATVGGKTYWLDGTRIGDSDLAELENYPYLWALPLRAEGAQLERHELPIRARAQASTLMAIDASAGLDAPAHIHVEATLQGDAAYAAQRALSAMPLSQAEQVLKKGFTQQHDWVQPTSVSWTYDEAHRVLHEVLDGSGKMDWEKDSEGRPMRWFEVDGSGFGRIGAFERPKDQDQTAPYAIAFPRYERWTVTIRMPKGQRFGFDGKNVRETFGGVTLVRRTRIVGDTVDMYRSIRTLKPEMSPEEAADADAKRLQFKDKGLFVRADDASAKPAPTGAVPEPKPGDAAGLLRAAYAQARSASYEKALAYADEAIAAKPNWDEALQVRGAVLSAQRRFGEAADAFGAAIQASKTPPLRLLLARADALRAANKPDEALQGLSQAVSAFPNDPGPHLQRAWIYLDRHDAKAALEEARAAEAVAPTDFDTLSVKTAALWALGQKAEAVGAQEAALAADPDRPVALTSVAYRYDLAGRESDARDALDEALAMDPLNVQTLVSFAQFESRHHRWAESIQRLDAALAVDPKSAILLNQRCWTRALADKDLDAAAKDCDAAIALRKDNPEAIDSRAFVSFRQHRYPDAVRGYTAALALKPDQAQSLYGRGLAKIKAGDRVGGQADVAAALKLNPEAGHDYLDVGLKP